MRSAGVMALTDLILPSNWTIRSATHGNMMNCSFCFGVGCHCSAQRIHSDGVSARVCGLLRSTAEYVAGAVSIYSRRLICGNCLCSTVTLYYCQPLSNGNNSEEGGKKAAMTHKCEFNCQARSLRLCRTG